MAYARSFRAPLLWTGYVLLPAIVSWRLRRAPVGLAVAVVLFAIWWTWRFRGTLPAPWLLITVLLIVKLLVGVAVSVEHGLEADYFANARWAPPASLTRIDRRLVFRGTNPTGRDTAPFSVTWQGYVPATHAEDRRTFYLRGKAVTAELWVDGGQTVQLEAGTEEAVDRARWPAGLRHLTVRLSSTEGNSPQFEAGFVGADGSKHPLGAANIVTRPYPQWRLSADLIFGVLGRAIDGFFLAVLFGMFGVTAARMIAAARMPGAERREAITAVAWVAILAGGLMFAMPDVDRLVIPGGPFHQPLYYLTLWLLACLMGWCIIRALIVLVPPEAE